MKIKQPSLKIVFDIISVIGVITAIMLCIYGYRLGIFQSTDKMNQFVAQFGYFAAFVFVIIQIVQVIIPIIPGGVSTLAGIVIFGPVYGFIYNYTGIVIGSIINFLLARHYGKPFVQSVASKKTYDKYIGWLDKGSRFDKLFTLAIFLPVAPDDILCLIAGLTKMTLKKFTLIILTCKPFSILAYSIGLSVIMNWLTNILK